jgi:hypothetical protein
LPHARWSDEGLWRGSLKWLEKKHLPVQNSTRQKHRFLFSALRKGGNGIGVIVKISYNVSSNIPVKQAYSLELRLSITVLLLTNV